MSIALASIKASAARLCFYVYAVLLSGGANRG